MGDHECRAAFVVAGSLQGEGHTTAILLVECRRGFVQQQHGFGQQQGCHQQHPLSLSAGELRGGHSVERHIYRQFIHQHR